jgi:hypothetical protein
MIIYDELDIALGAFKYSPIKLANTSCIASVIELSGNGAIFTNWC